MRRMVHVALLCLAAGGVLSGCASSPPALTFQPAQAPTEGWVARVDQYQVVVDGSVSMADLYRKERKIAIERRLVGAMGQAIPELGYAGSLRAFGRPETRLLWGMAPSSRSGFAAGLDALGKARGGSPLSAALAATATDLSANGAAKAVIVVSDGRHQGQDEVEAARALKAKHGDGLCIFTVQVGDDPDGAALLRQIAEAGGCGYATTAERLTNAADMAKLVSDALLEPDSDFDGVGDSKDRCPGTPRGVAVNPDGCPPDGDGDGVPDYLDKCPDTPAGVKVDASGCPLDSDGDGVPDDRDRCPGTPPGVEVDEHGCPTFGSPGDVLFDVNRYRIKPEGRKVLDAVAKHLAENPGLRLEVQGHCDRTGPEDFNRRLSQQRAEAVVAYLVKQGVAADRLAAKGYSWDVPVAPNDTRANRAKNRRVDFKAMF